MEAYLAARRRSLLAIILIFVVLSLGILSAGYLFYNNHAKHYQIGMECQLSSITNMKARVIEDWWQERFGDALIFYRNVTFSESVRGYFKNPNNLDSMRQVRIWLETVQTQHRYKDILLIDSKGIDHLAMSEDLSQVSGFLKQRALEAMQTGEVESTDVCRSNTDNLAYMAYLVPIVDPNDGKHFIATLVLRIDPQQFIYPFIKYWPFTSNSAETILARRDGDEVVYLNELRFRKNIPLRRRIPVGNTEYPAVKAVLGQEGVVQGIDYRGEEIIADVCQITGTPWYLESRIDKSEIYAPLKKQLWIMIFLVSSLIGGSGAFLVWLWDRQNVNFYRQRYEASETLKEVTLFNQEIVQGVSQGIVVFDNELRIVLWNPYLEEKTGINAAEVLGKRALEIFPHLKEQGIDELLALAAKGEIISTPEHPYYIPQTGKSGWVIASYSNHLNSKGEIVGVIASVMDITEIKLAQERIKLNEARLHSLYEISQHKFEDEQDLLNFALEQAVKLTGSKVGHLRQYDETEEVFRLIAYSHKVMDECKVTGRSTVRKLEETGLWGEAVRQRKAIAVNDYNAPNPFKKGQPAGHVELLRYLTVPVFYADKIVAVVGVANKESDYNDTDILQLSLLMEAAWRIIESHAATEQEKKLITAVEQSADSIVITDNTGTIIYVNPAVEKITGYNSRELIGQNPRVLKSGEHDQSFYKALWDTITDGKTWSGRFVNRRKDGATYQEEATISPVLNGVGKITNFVAVKRDVTKNLELQAQLFQAQKMEAIGILAGGFAHDFNNLLQVILGYLELILSSQSLPAQLQANLEEIGLAARSGATLVNRMLVFGRKTPTQIESVNLNTIVEQVRSLLGRSMPKLIAIELLMDKDLWVISADPGQMEQLLMNLAINARDAMPDGGRLTIETQNVVLDEEYHNVHLGLKEGRYALLSVTDTGAGMDEDTAKHIFEPFFTTKEVGKGTGLGLSVVYGIVEQHCGKIICDSQRSVGTKFDVYFPAIEETLNAQAHV